jgi:hypothetical protein
MPLGDGCQMPRDRPHRKPDACTGHFLNVSRSVETIGASGPFGVPGARRVGDPEIRILKWSGRQAPAVAPERALFVRWFVVFPAFSCRVF